MEELIATYDKTIYEKPGSGVSIGLYRSDKCYIITGTMLPTGKKIDYKFTGQWVKHPKYGLQFNAMSYEICKPTDKDAIIEYLSSGAIKGIGKVTAKKIYDVFGENSINILDDDIERLKEVKGITEKKFEKIKESYEANFEGRESILELTKAGFSAKIASKIYQEFKKNTIQTLKTRPYLFCIVPGITFLQADALGPKTREYEKDKERFHICSGYVLRENENGNFRSIIGNRPSGSTGMEINDFGRVLLSLLQRGTYTKEEIRANTVELIKSEKLIFLKKDDGKQYVFAPGMYRIEKNLAADITRLTRKTPITFDINKLIAEYENENKIALAEGQKNAIRTAFENNLSIIIGPPGTGKTTIIKAIAYIYERTHKAAEFCFMSLAGKAAFRITEQTGYFASTIHSRLGLGTETVYDIEEEDEYLINNESLVVVDELSMLDTRTAYKLFSNISDNCMIVLCGDDEQLQSVGAGAVLRDLIDSHEVPVAKLTNIFRQSEGSNIYINAQKIRNDEINLELSKDFYIMEESETTKVEDELTELYLKKIEEYGISEVMLLSPFKEHDGGVVPLNKKIQERLHPKALQKKEFVFGNKEFRIGDVVMQLKNSEEQVNGEIGTVIDIEKEDGEQHLIVRFPDSERVYVDDEVDELNLAYVYTIHKSEGSEAKCVIIYLHSMHGTFLRKSMIYTGITRCKKECVILGEKNAVIKAIQTTDDTKRITSLKEHLTWRPA